MNQKLTVNREFHVTRRHHGRKQLRNGPIQDTPSGRVPRIARLMALSPQSRIEPASEDAANNS